MRQTETGVRAQVFGRISKAPQLARTAQGVAVCRFVVASEPGPASNAVVKPIFVIGERGKKSAVQCARLRIGDLVLVPGAERQRVRSRRGMRFTESAIEAEDVHLKARGAD
ncbi:MAG TPA: hypothetical protein VHQ43_01220 [Solirubrobacterales bacterium]|jgi:hypothetical protein|nr:hypothetical protein [Solirubrobacterales bacterium]